jgi:hypothetical protein
MSSQGINTSSNAGYVSATLALGPIPLRDASDLTRRIREQNVYRENNANSTVQQGNPEDPWLKFANGYRLSYLNGKIKCGSCVGKAFNSNGAYRVSLNGAFGGS